MPRALLTRTPAGPRSSAHAPVLAAAFAAFALMFGVVFAAPGGALASGDRERAAESPLDDAPFVTPAPAVPHRVVLREAGAKLLPALLPAGIPPRVLPRVRGEAVAPSSFTLAFVTVVPRSPRGPPAA